MKKIYWRWHKLGFSRRIWIDGAQNAQCEVISNEDFNYFEPLCKRLGIVIEEDEHARMPEIQTKVSGR